MNSLSGIALFVLGAFSGGAFAYVIMRRAMADRRVVEEEMRRGLERSQQGMRDSFAAVGGEMLRQNSDEFIQRATREFDRAREAASGDLDRKEQAISEMLGPIKEGLEKYDTRLAEIERERNTTFGALRERLDHVVQASDTLRGETRNLVQALRSPGVRGRWGEMQLKRVCELAGMLERCDFHLQDSVMSEGGRLRPDMTVRLPGGKTIIVDAKTSIDAYMSAIDARSDAERSGHMKRHAAQVRTQVDGLSRKAYWDQFDHAPEFVLLFLPGEAFYSAALEQDPSLLEYGVEQRVIIATPTTLIALLKAISYGWRQEQVVENAQAISKLGKEMYERLQTYSGHFSSVGTSLNSAVAAYNASISSLESRLMVSARRFKELGATTAGDLAEIAPVDATARIPEPTSPRQLAEAVADAESVILRRTSIGTQ